MRAIITALLTAAAASAAAHGAESLTPERIMFRVLMAETGAKACGGMQISEVREAEEFATASSLPGGAEAIAKFRTGRAATAIVIAGNPRSLSPAVCLSLWSAFGENGRVIPGLLTR